MIEMTGVYDSRVTELVSVENVSSQGVGVTTTKQWDPGSHVDLSRPNGEKWARARIVYCLPNGGKRFAVGLNLLSLEGNPSSDFDFSDCAPITRQ